MSEGKADGDVRLARLQGALQAATTRADSVAEQMRRDAGEFANRLSKL